MKPDELSDGLPPERFDPPPPAPALLAAVQGMQPVRTRSRLGAFAAVGAAALVVPVLVLASHERRQDLIALPPGWVLAAAALWAIAFAASLAAALVPARGDVLPAPARGSRAGLGAVLALLVFVLCASVEAPGVSLRPEDVHRTLAGTAAHCAGFALLMAAPCLVLGLLALRRLAPMGGARLGLALGAAGGALGGLVLHFICPFANAGHVALGHVGGMALAAALAAVTLPLVRAR
ncbi:MAG TPA: NrsF family protein [Polyangia bacterium]|nr:NrsF family protein [Polyangia bacterium]